MESQMESQDATAVEFAAYAADLNAYAAAWDVDSAAAEVRLDRYADAYEAGLIVPAEDAAPAQPELNWRHMGMCAVISLVSLVIIVAAWL